MPTPNAHEFAAAWYARPENGRDRNTLAYLVAGLIQETAEAAKDAERKRIASNLVKLTWP